MSSPEETKIYAEFQEGISDINKAKEMLESARKKLGLCKICDEELSLLGKATGDLSTVTQISIDQMRMKGMEGLKKLPSVAAGLDKIAGEARDAAGIPSPASTESLGLFPDFLKPTELVKQIKNGTTLKPTMPHEMVKVGTLEPRGSMQRPPLPHEMLGIEFPLPGKMFRQMTDQK